MKIRYILISYFFLLSCFTMSNAEKTFINYKNPNHVNTIVSDGKNTLWVGSNLGVIRWNLSDGSYIKYTTDEGLIDNNVTSIAIDSLGNVWAATVSMKGDLINSNLGLDYYVIDKGGVNKFDGTMWTAFTKKDGLLNNNVSAIVTDSRRNIWFGISSSIKDSMGISVFEKGGLSKFDGTNWTNYTIYDSLNNIVINSIAIDMQNNLWIVVWPLIKDKRGEVQANNYNGVIKYNGTIWTTYTRNEGLVSNDVRSISMDSFGNMWFGTVYGISRFNGTSWTQTILEGPGENSVHVIATDSKGNVWFGVQKKDGGSYQGVSNFDGSMWTNYTMEDGLVSNYVTAIATDYNGNVFFGTEADGISKFDGKNWKNYITFDGPASNNIRSIATDLWGNVWFWTYENNKLINYDGKSWKSYNTEDLSTQNIYSDFNELPFIVDFQGNVWIGTQDHGVFKFNGSNWKNYTTEDGLSSNSVSAIAPDSKGNIWIVTKDESSGECGINIFDGKKWSLFTTLLHICAIKEDLKGNIWFGSFDSGVIKYDGSIFTVYKTDKFFGGREFAMDSNGHIWVTGPQSDNISRFDGLGWTTFKIDNEVKSITYDFKGNMWVGTNMGLIRFDGSSWITYTIDDGLLDNNIMDIATDFQGNIWIGTYYGISFFKNNVVDNWMAGDVNGDNKLDIFDLLEFLKILGGKELNALYLYRADFNKDGKKDIFDLLWLLKKLSGT